MLSQNQKLYDLPNDTWHDLNAKKIIKNVLQQKIKVQKSRKKYKPANKVMGFPLFFRKVFKKWIDWDYLKFEKGAEHHINRQHIFPSSHHQSINKFYIFSML